MTTVKMPHSLDCSHRTRSVTGHSRRGTLLASAAIALALGACKKDDAAADGKTDGKTAEAGSTDSKGGTTPGTATAPGSGTNPTDQPLTPATQIQRGDVLAHFIIPNGSALITELKTQIVPAAQGAMLDENTLRTMAGAGLGERGKLATNLDLGKPFGCALVDSQATMVPVACVVGYKGGAAALVADLGNEGKQADAAGHVAKFSMGGQDVFIDELGGDAVISNHTELFAKAKGYLETNIVGRAGSLASDIEVVAFPAGLMTRYQAQLEPLLQELAKAQTMPAGDNPMAKAMASYQKSSNERMIKMGKELDQFTLAFSIEPVGFVARTAMFPVAGSDFETEMKAAAAGPLDASMVERLPKSAWLVAGFASNIHRATATPTFKEMRSTFIGAYADAVKKDPAAVTKAVDEFIAENDKIYGDHSAFALLHEPGTLGGLVGVTALEPGQSGREAWKTWSAAFTPDAVLGAEGAKKVTWSFQADAATIGGVPVDRWTIEPTEASKADLRKEGGEELKQWEERMGGLKLVVNRIEKDGKAAFVVAPGSDDKTVQAVIDALGATNSLTGDPGLTAILTRNPGVSFAFGANVKGAIGWIKELLPPDKTASIPADLGNGLDDVFAASSYAGSSSSGEIVVSQRFIDQLRALAK